MLQLELMSGQDFEVEVKFHNVGKRSSVSAEGKLMRKPADPWERRHGQGKKGVTADSRGWMCRGDEAVREDVETCPRACKPNHRAWSLSCRQWGVNSNFKGSH